jgi:hypothetical protein
MRNIVIGSRQLLTYTFAEPNKFILPPRRFHLPRIYLVSNLNSWNQFTTIPNPTLETRMPMVRTVRKINHLNWAKRHHPYPHSLGKNSYLNITPILAPDDDNVVQHQSHPAVMRTSSLTDHLTYQIKKRMSTPPYFQDFSRIMCSVV